MEKAKISFCTTCMNRLAFIKQTIEQNIFDNGDYDNLEFVLLDYNSSDGLMDYVQTDLQRYISEQKLVYYRTTEPQNYSMSHSRNLAFKLATGEIVCNIDADNFTGKKFATYINNVFQSNDKIFISTHNNAPVKNDVLGRICVKKEHFLAIGGYDERMKHYGFDDYDLVNRLKMYGLQQHTLVDLAYLKAISHSNEVRMFNGISVSNLDNLYINHSTPAESLLLFLFRDGTSCRGTIVNNRNYNGLIERGQKPKNLNYKYSILEKFWTYGTWLKQGKKMLVNFPDHSMELSFLNDSIWSGEQSKKYFQITSNPLKQEMVFFLHQMSNRLILEENLENLQVRVNEDEFGNDTCLNKFIK